MLSPGWTVLVALAAAYVIAVPATPAGVSGAVLLLPFQVSVLGTQPVRDADQTCCTTWLRRRGRYTRTGGKGSAAGGWP